MSTKESQTYLLLRLLIHLVFRFSWDVAAIGLTLNISPLEFTLIHARRSPACLVLYRHDDGYALCVQAVASVVAFSEDVDSYP